MGWAARTKSQRVCPECGSRAPVLVPVTLRIDGTIDSVCPKCETTWIKAAYLWPRPERAADEGLLRHRLAPAGLDGDTGRESGGVDT